MSERQEIIISRELSTEELYQIMLDHWDAKSYGEFFLTNRNVLSEELAIFLPATKHFMILVEPTVEGIIRAEAKVVLYVTETPKGMEETLRRSFPASNLFLGAIKIGRLASIKKEQREIESTVLIKYAEYLREILEQYGLC